MRVEHLARQTVRVSLHWRSVDTDPVRPTIVKQLGGLRFVARALAVACAEPPRAGILLLVTATVHNTKVGRERTITMSSVPVPTSSSLEARRKVIVEGLDGPRVVLTVTYLVFFLLFSLW